MAGSRSARGVRRTALAAVLAALSLFLLYASCLLPSGRLGLVAVAGLVPAAAVVSAGLPTGCFCFFGSGLLALLLLPSKSNAILYLLFFGLYPLVKSLIERLHSLPLEYLCKLIFFNGALSLIWFGLRTLLLPFLPSVLGQTWLVYLVGNGTFLFYDFGFSKLIFFYTQRVDRVLRRN